MAIKREVPATLLDRVKAAMASRQIDPTHRSPRELIVAVCSILNEFHIVENAGDNRSKNGDIELLQDTIGGHNGESYCMATQQTVTGLVEALTGFTSNLYASESCSDVYDHARQMGLKILPVAATDIEPGDIAIWRARDGSWRGHAGRVIRPIPNTYTFETFEGNVGLGDKLEGVKYKERNRGGWHDMYLAGFIRETFSRS